VAESKTAFDRGQGNEHQKQDTFTMLGIMLSIASINHQGQCFIIKAKTDFRHE